MSQAGAIVGCHEVASYSRRRTCTVFLGSFRLARLFHASVVRLGFNRIYRQGSVAGTNPRPQT